MSDPRRSSSSSSNDNSVGGGNGESGLGQGECAGTGGVGWGDRRGETSFCSRPVAEMLSELKDELGEWCF